MITLITGSNGTGKTALLVKMLSESLETKNRPLYVDGVTDLVIPHDLVPPLAEWTRQDMSNGVLESHFVFPEGSLVVVDEVQRYFRPRSNGSAVPLAVQALETHRHLGLDFWFITQHPNLLDPNIRKLIHRHIHIRSTFMGRYIYEFTECGDVDNASARQLAAKRKYKLPKKSFDLYKSASIHTSVKRRVPVYVYVFVLALFGLGGTIYYIKNAISSKLHPVASSETSVNLPGAGVSNPMTLAAVAAQKEEPKVAGLAFTASKYSEITKPVDAPFPVACIASKSRCSCSSQQATPLDVPEKLCREIVAGGIFRDWEPRQRQENTRVASSNPLPAAADIDRSKKYLTIDPPPVLRASPGFGAHDPSKDKKADTPRSGGSAGLPASTPG